VVVELGNAVRLKHIVGAVCLYACTSASREWLGSDWFVPEVYGRSYRLGKISLRIENITRWLLIDIMKQ
jgi:hypothetical protein